MEVQKTEHLHVFGQDHTERINLYVFAQDLTERKVPLVSQSILQVNSGLNAAEHSRYQVFY